MKFILANNELFSAELPGVKISNRGFHYGDGFFETIRILDGKPCFYNAHFERILKTAKALGMILPDDFSKDSLLQSIHYLLKENSIFEGGRMRITFTRSGDGFYLPEKSTFDFFIEAKSVEHNIYTLNQQGRSIDIYPDIRKQINLLSIYKTLNCQIYVMASLSAKNKGLDDCLIQNDRNNIIEASSSNVFIVSNGVLYTPTLDDGCVGGVMRMQIINLALENKIKVYECNLTPQHLLAADEIFLTNAIQGIQWVSSYRTKRYFNENAKKFIQILNAAAKI